MKVLLLTQVLPYPPDSGPEIKTWNVIKYLAQNHEITLVSFVRGNQSADVDHLRSYCKAVHTVPMERGLRFDVPALFKSVFRNQPWMIVRDERRKMNELIDLLVQQTRFDVVHADQLNMVQYAQRVPGAKKILDAHNALWLLYKRLAGTMKPGPKKWLLERDWRLLKRYEGRICSTFDSVLAVSKEDLAALEQAAGEPFVSTVIPIAVDTDELLPVHREPGANHILHIGTMYWPPNIDGMSWFIDEIYPLIRAQRPDITLDIVGSRPPQSILSLNDAGIGVNVTGYVPDPSIYLQQAGVMIVPLRAGGGMRVKILEALAQAMPMVTTTLGCEGIAVENGRHLLVADSPEEFAQATLRLLGDSDQAARLGANGRQLIETTYDYRVACQPLEGIYTDQGELQPV